MWFIFNQIDLFDEIISSCWDERISVVIELFEGLHLKRVRGKCVLKWNVYFRHALERECLFGFYWLRLFKALEINTRLEVLLLSNTGLNDRTGDLLIQTLEKNSSLRVIKSVAPFYLLIY